MDSLTQIVLGAAVGEAVCGRKIGNKALVWGAIAGTIPDLDVLANPLLGMVEELTFHRSVTHSLLFALLVSPLLGWGLRRLYKKHEATFSDWTTLFFLGFTTHALLDSFTTWGTQLFWPFSSYGVAFYNIFVVDPLYTLPFLAFVVAAAFYHRRHPRRQLLNYLGLGISTAYLAFSFAAKAKADNVFERNLQARQIAYSSYISKPTPLNTLLWTVTAEGKEGYYTGFYSLLDKDEQVTFAFEPRNSHLLEPYRGNPKFERLLQITKGYYAAEKADKGIILKDLRFGQYDGWRNEGGQYVFKYQVRQQESGALEFEMLNYRPQLDKSYFTSFLNRIGGQK